jgi:SAM-dependent methyltransferase
MFRDYVYFSSYSETMVRHVQTLVEELIAERRLGRQSKVLEAASNDGYLLQFYAQAQIPVLGIEPAKNIAQVARTQKGIPTIDEFFGEELGRRLRLEGHQADVFHAHNVLAHVPDPNSFVKGIREVLKESGVAVIEVPYVRDTIEQCEFDQVYHEHLFYYSLTALTALFGRQGLQIHDVERVPVHGGSLRLYVQHAKSGASAASVQRLLQEEKRIGLDKLDYYLSFG